MGGKLFNIFLDHAKQEVPGPIIISGVGDHKSICENGIYIICLPLKNGSDAIFIGVCSDRVTTNFPKSKAGQAVLDSCFLSVDGTTGVIGGPHAVFTEVDRQYYSTQIVNNNVEAQSNLVTMQFGIQTL